MLGNTRANSVGFHRGDRDAECLRSLEHDFRKSIEVDVGQQIPRTHATGDSMLWDGGVEYLELPPMSGAS
jgi:hypothetical protein